jgi:hypothetical protein
MVKVLRMKQYANFVRDFSRFMQTEHSDVCYYGFGSVIRGDCEPERGSDVDGGIILNLGPVIPREKINEMAKGLCSCLQANPIKVQFNLIDTTTGSDRRFLSYTSDYTDYLREHARVFSGPNFLQNLRGLDYGAGVLHSAAFNFRRARNGLLTFCWDINEKPREAVEGLWKAVVHAGKFPKKLIWLHGEDEIVTSRHEALARVKEMLPQFNPEKLERLNRMTICDLDGARDLFSVYSDAVEAMESLIGSYIVAFPKITEREARSN